MSDQTTITVRLTVPDTRLDGALATVETLETAYMKLFREKLGAGPDFQLWWSWNDGCWKYYFALDYGAVHLSNNNPEIMIGLGDMT